jgi:hypothetical protein
MAPHYQVPNADALHARELGKNVMPRFYFHLTSKENNIPDYSGKELDTLTDAYEHARALIDKILFHVGHDDGQVYELLDILTGLASFEGRVLKPTIVSYS